MSGVQALPVGNFAGNAARLSRIYPMDANATRGGTVASVREAVARLDKTGTRLHAVAQRLDDAALAEARRCDGLAATGSSAGPLHGPPFVEILNVAGVPTRSGSLARASNAPCACTRRRGYADRER